MTWVDGVKYGVTVWQGQTEQPNIDSTVFALKMVGWSALAAWAIRKGPLSPHQIMLIPIAATLGTMTVANCHQARPLIDQSGLWIEPLMSTLLVTGGYSLYRAGGSLLPSCVRSFRWTTLLDLSYHGVVGILGVLISISSTAAIWSEIREGDGICFPG